MDNRAYAFAFMGVLAIVCLGAYVAMSALFDVNGDPLVRFASPTADATLVALATRPAGTRTVTPTATPFVVFVPTEVLPTATRVPPTPTSSIPPLPSPRLLPTRTPTITPIPSETPTPQPTSTQAPQPSAIPTIPAPPPHGNFPFEPVDNPSVDRSRSCSGQYYIYGFVRDAQNQPLVGVRVHYVTQTVFPHSGVTEAKGYELTVGSADAEWFLTIVDSGDRPLSPTISVRTSGLQAGSCWFVLNWRRS